jgi:cold shock protein
MTEATENMNTEVESNDSIGEHLGQVQWFNKKKGYGFIKNVNNPSDDIFFHFSNICTEGYKIIYPGEFVSMNIESGDDGQSVCKNIRGVGGLPLLTDNENYHYKVMPKRNVHQ